ncbi:MAG TPA: MBL fold metallo-hydrolase [Vicinamibacterales bacterium]|jgi:glyoxylase-like metal-dependent hydrolase (beta-lactamase superfamily II)
MVHAIDLEFLGRPRVIASGLIERAGSLAVVDPGPTTTLSRLRTGVAARGRAFEEIDTVLLTHVHLDHAGATGAIVRALPRVQVYVHERGAPHVIDPSKLVQSATRLYGDEMDRLWGEIVPVPAANVHAMKGGERIRAAGGEIDVAYTPGHAWHHVSYFDPESGTAFTGDVGGIRIGDPLFVVPPTPPPDIDLEAWAVSIDRVRAWKPRQLFLTHFGPHDDAAAHLDELESRLSGFGGIAWKLVADPTLDEEQRMARYIEAMRRALRDRMPDEEAMRRYDLAVPLDHCWIGLARYWRKRQT